MKAYYLLAPLGIALAGCSVYPPVAVERVYTTPATVATTPPSTVVMGASPSQQLIDSDSDGHADSVDRHPFDALRY